MTRERVAGVSRLRRRPERPAGSPGGTELPLDAGRAEPVLGKLQLLINRKLDGLLQGDYLGLLPGPGTEPGESREYRAGDDVRRMDWPVTARTTVPHVRQTVADRELETWLAVDLSASLDFGTATCLKRDLAVAAAAAMSHLTVRGGNRPPRRRGLAVVISDFLVPPAQWERPLRRLGVRHDLLAIEIVDPRELELSDAGVMEFVDPETGRLHEVHTGDPALRAKYAAGAAAQRAAIAAAIRGANAAHLRLRTDRDWLLDIVRFVAAQRHARTRGTTR